jgi:hypothetical protein
VVIASAAVALLASLLAVAAVTPAAARSGPRPDRPIEPVEVIPDVTLLTVGGPIVDPAALVDRLEAIDGVVGASIDQGGEGDHLIHLALAEGADRAIPLDVVVDRASEAVTAEVDGVRAVEPGGSAIVDRHLVDRFDRSAGSLAWFGLVVGVGLGLVFGLRRGALVAVAIALAVVAAGSIGRQVAGGFDATMGTTALPAALAGLVVAAALAYRLLVWFQRPSGADGAARIERAVVDLGPELVLLGAGLGASALIVEPLNPGRSAVTTAVVGAVVAAVVVLALVAPALAVLGPERPGPLAGLLPLSAPDGRDLPLPMVAIAVLVLTVVSAAALGQVGGDLLAVDELDDSSGPARVAEAQARRGGDPTEALAAVAPEASTSGDFAGWATLVAERSEVAWVDLGAERLTATGSVDLDPSALLTSPDLPGVAVIVPAVSPRSVEGQALVERVTSIPLAGGEPRFLGPAADTAGVAGSRTPVLVAIGLMAAASGLAALALTGNGALAALAAGLRLVGGGATVGLHNLISSDPSTSSALTALVAVGLGGMLAEFELVRRLDHESEAVVPRPGATALPVGTGDDIEVRPDPSPGPVPGPRSANAGQYGALGLAALAVAGLVLALVAPIGGGPGTFRLGVAIVLGALVELVAGTAVVRPALLGQRAAYQTAARPLRVALHGRSTGDPQAGTPPDDDPLWREVAIDLIQTEFWLQSEPERAQLDLVFEADTPVHRQAAGRNASLVGSGLRVVGRTPELRSLRTVRDRLPVIVTVTVDHPESQLVDREGKVVGIRRPERRIGRLWLGIGPDGGYRIVESIELGAVPLVVDGGVEPGAEPAARSEEPTGELVEG